MTSTNRRWQFLRLSVSLLLFFSPLGSASEFAKSGAEVHMGIDWVRTEDACASFSGTASSGNFFKGLQRLQTRSGFQFQREGAVVASYPDTLTMNVTATAGACTTKANPKLDDVKSGIQLSTQTLESLRFEASWKNGFEMSPAQVTMLSSVRMQVPEGSLYGTKWWRYTVQVPSKGMSLKNDLVLIISNRQGQRLARLSLRP